ncbi:single-stranded DNA-binding protein [Methylohalobius crimeensis]|uniref:single-stranded DNA-binding protein n=1 Tax=Methylohalobius crimeensis TaxID=244365 RepID=UPI0003B6EC52|nr:single-stranded DNA-binding protein [Methylohalobius crimeensis]
MIHISAYGRLGRDPETRTTKSGKSMTTARMACDATPGNSDEQETVWIQVLAFGKQAETLAKHQKGETLAVTGRLTQSRWTGKDGEERIGFSVIVDSMVSSRTVRPGGKRKSAKPAPPDTAPPDFDDEIPF